MRILKKCDIIKLVINAVSKITKEGRKKLNAIMFFFAFILKMSIGIKVKTFSKKEAQQLIKIFKKDLLKKPLLETEKDLIIFFKRHLNKINLECLVTSKEKIIYSFGKRIEQYQNNKISNYLSDCINDNSLASMKGSYLEIINKKNVRGIYIYKNLTFRNINIGSLIFISRSKLTDKQIELLTEF